MSNELNNFLNTGFNRYKEAHDVYWHFRNEIKVLLTTTMTDRENFGRLDIKADSIFFKHWGNGLYLTSRIDGKIEGNSFSIGIGIDWGYEFYKKPIPFAWIEDENRKYIKLHDIYSWTNDRYNKNQQLGYTNSFSVEELDMIFNNLMDELVAYLDELVIMPKD